MIALWIRCPLHTVFDSYHSQAGMAPSACCSIGPRYAAHAAKLSASARSHNMKPNWLMLVDLHTWLDGIEAMPEGKNLAVATAISGLRAEIALALVHFEQTGTGSRTYSVSASVVLNVWRWKPAPAKLQLLYKACSLVSATAVCHRSLPPQSATRMFCKACADAVSPLQGLSIFFPVLRTDGALADFYLAGTTGGNSGRWAAVGGGATCYMCGVRK